MPLCITGEPVIYAAGKVSTCVDHFRAPVRRLTAITLAPGPVRPSAAVHLAVEPPAPSPRTNVLPSIAGSLLAQSPVTPVQCPTHVDHCRAPVVALTA